MLNFSKWILKKWIAAQKREMNGQWHRFFLSLLRWIILAFSLINFTKCNFNRTWNYHVKNKFATKIRCKQNANHFESVINRGQDKHPQYLNEYDIRRLRINIHCRINPRSGKDSFDSLFGQPSIPDSFSTLRSQQEVSELLALLACTFGGNSVSTVNSRLCDRNQRRSLLLQRLIKTNRCATDAGTRGERSRGVVYRMEGRCGRKFIGRSVGGLENAF